MTPAAMPSSSITSETMPLGPSIAAKRSTTPSGSRGTLMSLMRSVAIRPVSRLFVMLIAQPFRSMLPVPCFVPETKAQSQ